MKSAETICHMNLMTTWTLEPMPRELDGQEFTSRTSPFWETNQVFTISARQFVAERTWTDKHTKCRGRNVA